jgi:hypothetical protein
MRGILPVCAVFALIACGDANDAGPAFDAGADGSSEDAGDQAGAGGAAAASGDGGRGGSGGMIGSGGSAGAGARDASVDAAELDAGDDAAPSACLGAAPPCFAECAGDAIEDEPAVCSDGAWDCEQGVLRNECPGACFGVPLPGEVCEQGVWQCKPELTDAFELCPSYACPNCDSFTGSVEKMGCRCTCESTGVTCEAIE